MSINLTAQEQTTIRTAAFGAVTLLSFAGVAGSARKVATEGTLAFASATGAVGHVLASKKRDFKLKGRSAADYADYVLPALSASVELLEARDAAEAENFRTTIRIAVEAANRAHQGAPSPVMAAMSAKITEAVGA